MPVYNKEFLETKIKSHGDKVTDFNDKKFPRLDSNHTRLAVITLDSALKKYDSHYPQLFLKECKCNLGLQFLLWKEVSFSQNNVMIDT